MNIVIYGGGNYGSHVGKQIISKNTSQYNLTAFIDNKKIAIDGIDVPVYTEEAFFAMGQRADCYIVAMADQNIATSVVVSLIGRGVEEIYIYKNPFIVSMADVFDEGGNFSHYIKHYKKVTPIFGYTINFHVVDHCNLNCRGCSSFSNISEEGYISLQEAEETMYSFRKRFNYTERINFYGGEALLHPDIAEILTIARRVFPKTDLYIYSNGLAIPQISEKLISVMQRDSVSFEITQYPPTRRMLTKIVDFLDMHSINYFFIMEKNSFYYCFVNEADGEKNWELCKKNHNCFTIYHGKLFRCPTAPHMMENKEYLGLAISDKEENAIGYDLSGDGDGWELLYELDAHPYSICRFCNPAAAEGISEGDYDRDCGLKWESGRDKAKREDWFLPGGQV